MEIERPSAIISKNDFFDEFPEIKKSLDKDGLIELSFGEDGNFEDSRAFDGVFIGKYFIYVDNGFTFNVTERVKYNRFFLRNFFELSKEYKNKAIFKIKLDFDNIIDRSLHQDFLLKSTIQGPSEFEINKVFSPNKESIITKLQRTNSKFDTKISNKINITEFLIDSKNHSFQIEELGDNLFNNYYTNRYIHTEFNEISKEIKHFDGSLIGYTKDGLKLRNQTDLSKYEHHNIIKSKIFRIDGNLKYNDRLDLTHKYYVNNEAILEYFDKEKHQQQYSGILDYENYLDY